MVSHKQAQDHLSNAFIVLVLVIFLLPLDAFSGSAFGHLVGIIGTVLMSMTLIYPYRKYVLGQKGKQNPLSTHIYYGLAGPIMVVLHSGSGFKSLIGTLLYLSLVIVVLSGITGKFLFSRVNKTFKARQKDLTLLRAALQDKLDDVQGAACGQGGQGVKDVVVEALAGLGEGKSDAAVRAGCAELNEISLSMAETESVIRAWSTAKKLFSYWRKLHVYLVYILMAMTVVHVISTLYYGLRWLP